jgi:hypothetical protein
MKQERKKRVLDKNGDQFKFMHESFDRLQNGEINDLKTEMAQTFGIKTETAHIKLTTYYFNRMMDKPLRGFEQDGQIILVYGSKINKS